jgi:hypothetical protein
MEDAFGEDFSGVEAFRGKGNALHSLSASAATEGERIAFASAEPDRATVGHELTHIVQRRRSPSTGMQLQSTVSAPDEPAEREAEAAARSVASGGVAGPIHANSTARIGKVTKTT